MKLEDDVLKGRRVRALALLQMLILVVSMANLYGSDVPKLPLSFYGYQAMGIVRILPMKIGIEDTVSKETACASGEIPDAVQEMGAVPMPFLRSRCPLRRGHWPLPVSLLFGLPIHLNELDATDFETLPGVGPVLAGRIIAHRDDVRGFRRAEDLLNVHGLGEKKYLRIRSELSSCELRMGDPFDELAESISRP